MNGNKKMAIDEASVVLYTKQTPEQLRAIREQKKIDAKTNPVPRARISWHRRKVEGWTRGTREHYVVNGRSLCGRPFADVTLAPGPSFHWWVCKMCQRALTARSQP